MYKVVVLSDDESKKSIFLENLGMAIIDMKHIAMLCSITAESNFVKEARERKEYTFEVFGLLTESKKLDEFIKTRDGVIIMIDNKNINSSTFQNRIAAVNKLCPNKPVMIVVEDEANNKHAIGNLLKFTDNLTKRVFDVSNYTDSWKAKEWFSKMLKRVKPRQIYFSSRTMPDDKMMSKFGNCELPLELWDHYGRLRIVYLSIIHTGIKDTINPDGWLMSHWRRYKASIGHGHLWHYTLTRLWINIIYNLHRTGKYKTFHELFNANPHIQKGGLFKEYYSMDRLFTPKARKEWVPPDKIN